MNETNNAKSVHTVANAGKFNRDAVALVKAHKIVLVLNRARGADDKARARVGEAIRKGDLTSTTQAVNLAHRAKRALDALGFTRTANGLRMAYGSELDIECIDADTRKMLNKIDEACADIRAAFDAAKSEKDDEEVELIKAEDADELANANG